MNAEIMTGALRRPRSGIPPERSPTATLCDYCANACGGCRWSQKGIQRPVPGWDAVRRDICLTEDRPSPPVESYVVIHCPEFQAEYHREAEYRQVNWEEVRRRARERTQ